MNENVQLNTRIKAVLVSTVFLDLIGFGILIPVQPFYAISFGAAPSTVTLLSASFSLMQFLFMPFWGRLSDKIGRRPVMLVSMAISAFGFALFAAAGQLWLLFIARSIAGIGSANIGMAQAIIADSTTTEQRAKGMGLLGAAFGAGFIIGPAIGGYFGQIALWVPALFAAALALINLLLAAFLLPETLHKSDAKRAINQWSAMTSIFRPTFSTQIVQLLVLSFLFTFSFSLFEQAISLFFNAIFSNDVDYRIENNVVLTSYFLIVVGVTSVIVQGVLLSWLARVFGEKGLLLVGSFLLTLCMLFFPQVAGLKNTPLLLLFASLLALGTGLILPTTASLLSKYANSSEEGMILGYGQSFGSLGRVIGPSLSGFFFQNMIEAPFFGASLIMLVCFVITYRLAAK